MPDFVGWLVGLNSALVLAALGGALKAWRDVAEHRRDHLALVHRVTVAEADVTALAAELKQSRHDLRGDIHRMTLELERGQKDGWKALEARVHDLELRRTKR